MRIAPVLSPLGLLFLLPLAAFAADNAPPVSKLDFTLRDGDVVVFLGDSITAERTYGKIIENFTLLRFPERKIRFANAGWGGDTAAGGLERLERDVFARRATVVTVAYGINDIGWGFKADEEHRQKYLDGIRGIVAECKRRGVRVFICSAAATAADPDESADDFLQKMCDDGMQIARDAGEGAIDVLRGMRQIQRRIKQANANEPDEKKHEALHVADGVHLNELGQTAMAYAILKGLGAPEEVSSATIDAAGAKVLSAERCEIRNLDSSVERVEFERLDRGLPFNMGLFFNLRYRFIPFPEELNRYVLTVKNLRAGDYALEVEGRGLGTFSSEQLSSGVNLASATADGWEPGGPWDAQAWALTHLTNARNEAEQARKTLDHYLANASHTPAVREEIEQLIRTCETAQRTIAKPAAYRFQITRVAEAK